jgi:hypothetical protein
MTAIRDAHDGILALADAIRAKRDAMNEIPVDHLGRPVIDDATKQLVREAFSIVPPDKNGALLVIAEHGADGEVHARAHLAFKIDDHWKVAGGLGWRLGEKRPAGWVGVEATW